MSKRNIINIRLDGELYTGFTDISVDTSIEKMSRSFSFSVTARDEIDPETGKAIVKRNQISTENNPVKLQSTVEILIDGEVQLTGSVEDISLNYSATSHSIQVSGRDLTGNVIDSSILQREYKERNLTKLFRLVLDDNGFEDVHIENALPYDPTLPPNEVIRTELNDTVFSFLDKYAQRLQVILITDESGVIVIGTEGVEGFGGYVINERNNVNSNVLSASFTLSASDRYRFIEVFSQSGNDVHTRSSIVQNGSFIDEEILANRRKIITAGKATQKSVLDQLAEWHATVKRAKGKRYECEVAGFYTNRNDGILWKPNTLINIIDEISDLHGEFLIQGVTFKQSVSGGSKTSLSIVDRGAFTIDPEKKFDYAKSKKNVWIKQRGQ